MNFNEIEKPKIESIKTPEKKIKKGVDLLFKQNPGLSQIGTKEQYSKYLDSIFPESKIKEIGYHNGEMKKFPESTGMSFFTDSRKAANKFLNYIKKENNTIKKSSAVFDVKNPKIYRYFLSNLLASDSSSFEDSENNIRRLKADELQKEEKEIPNSNFFYRKIFRDSLIKEGYDSIITGPDTWLPTEEDFPYSKQFILFYPSQIHLLGSEEDIENFKEYVAKKE